MTRIIFARLVISDLIFMCFRPFLVNKKKRDGPMDRSTDGPTSDADLEQQPEALESEDELFSSASEEDTDSEDKENDLDH